MICLQTIVDDPGNAFRGIGMIDVRGKVYWRRRDDQLTGDTPPAVAPGGQIAVERSGGIWLLDSRASRRTKLLDDAVHPTWVPQRSVVRR